MTKKTQWTTKKGDIITEAYCRRCLKVLPVENFYASVDMGKVDTNGLMSVCKDCTNELYQIEYDKCKSVEEAIHKTCITLNLVYNPDAVEATKAHINTMVEGGLAPPPLFSTYKAKLTAFIPTDQKGKDFDFTYKDLNGTVYIVKDPAIPVKLIPKELLEFWGDQYTPEEIEYMEREFGNAKQTHKADTWAEITLLKEVCYKMLELKRARKTNADTSDLVKELQVLFKNLAISPNAVNTGANAKTSEAFGNWIADIERNEPAQWYEEDGKKYSLIADVDDVESYFERYFVRPLKNFITGSRDFNIGEEDDISESLFDEVPLETQPATFEELPTEIKNGGGEEESNA